mgnify:FL=1
MRNLAAVIAGLVLLGFSGSQAESFTSTPALRLPFLRNALNPSTASGRANCSPVNPGLTGCSSVGSGLLGGVLGAGAAGSSYEFHPEAPEGSGRGGLQSGENRSKGIRDPQRPDSLRLALSIKQTWAHRSRIGSEGCVLGSLGN